MLRAAARLSLTTVLAVVVPGCGGGASGGSVEVNRAEEVPVELTIRLRGDLDATVEKQVIKSKFVLVRTKAPEREATQVVGLEPLEPIPVGGAAFKAGFAIIPFRGDGKYTIKPGSPYDAQKEEEEAQRTGTARSRSSVSVEWFPTGDQTQEGYVYLRRVEPCEAKVEDDATKGRVFCPRVTQEGTDKHFSLEIVWRLP